MPAPDLSVVIVTDALETIGRWLGHVRAQGRLEGLELVVVAPSAARIDAADPQLDGFGAVRIVELERLTSVPEARAAGIQACSAPVVVLAETHSFPDPGWADALVAAHRGPWAAVGPVVRNANPETAISWADLLLDYARGYRQTARPRCATCRGTTLPTSGSSCSGTATSSPVCSRRRRYCTRTSVPEGIPSSSSRPRGPGT